MYTEGFDDLSEAENRPSRTYVSGASQDMGKLQRDNERLKKSLEKEQFFNRLLDQELKELKAERGMTYDQDRYKKSNGVSRGAFNTLLLFTLALAFFSAYTVYFNKQYNLFPQRSGSVANAETPSAAQPAAGETGSGVITDSVPNIIARSTPATSSKSIPPVTEKPAAEKQHTSAELQKPKAAAPIQKAETPPAEEETVADETVTTEQPVTEQPVAAQPARPVLARYRVTSKANFYNAPDENTMKSYFISQSNDKFVDALEDRNGFIYVEFKNDVGYVTKGWLSKKDLTKE